MGKRAPKSSPQPLGFTGTVTFTTDGGGKVTIPVSNWVMETTGPAVDPPRPASDPDEFRDGQRRIDLDE